MDSIHYLAPVQAHPADGRYCDKPLGALYQPQQCTFRVWAPTAEAVQLHLYHHPTAGVARTLDLTGNQDGSWETTVVGNWLGTYYTYSVSGSDARFDPHRELLDPYAKCVTAHNGRGMVVHDETPVAPRPTFPLAEAIIYELHLRDFTIDPDCGVQRRGKYLGLTETGTAFTGRNDIVTGLDHLTELGVNVVQLLPVSTFHTDAANDLYGWGYDVVQHFSPEGWYATERLDARRIKELKQMISALHERGMRVTLDVVFNHTFEALNKNLVFNFEGLVPGYYYRLKNDGSYWDGSGTGNEFRTEAPMVRRYIVDCLRHWVNEYQVDGFRFDLLGLLDQATVELVVAELRAIDPQLLIYGEPWAGGTSPISLTGKGAQRGQGWAVFNDHYRDALKGNVFNARQGGFIQSGLNQHSVKRGVRGALEDFTASPTESINYVECHDNHTLWDRLLISTADDARVTEAQRRAMSKLAAMLLLTSQGVPFIHAGQEMLRTKGGDHNSYNKPDTVNMLRWRWKAEHHDVYEYYRGLIALRRAHPLLRLATAEQVRQCVKFLDDDLHRHLLPGCLAYQIEIDHDIAVAAHFDAEQWQCVLVLCNATAQPLDFTIPTGTWQVHADARSASVMSLRTVTVESDQQPLRVAAQSGLLLAR